MIMGESTDRERMQETLKEKTGDYMLEEDSRRDFEINIQHQGQGQLSGYEQT